MNNTFILNDNSNLETLAGEIKGGKLDGGCVITFRTVQDVKVPISMTLTKDVAKRMRSDIEQWLQALGEE